MKKIYILLLCLSIQSIGFTQDIIYKTDGVEIKAKVIEIEETVIKYKNFEQQEGPIRNISKSQVFMIKYQDGTIEKFTTIANIKDKATYDTIGEKDSTIPQDIDIQIERATSMKKAGNTLLCSGVFGIVSGIGCIAASKNAGTEDSRRTWNTVGSMFLAVSIPLVISGIAVTCTGRSRIKEFQSMKAGLSLQMVPFDNVNKGNIKSAQALSLGIRVSF